MSAWGQITMAEVCIVTRAAFGAKLMVNGTDCACMVCDPNGENGIGVARIDSLRELVPALRPASIALHCTEAERPALLALVEQIKQDRRCVEALQ